MVDSKTVREKQHTEVSRDSFSEIKQEIVKLLPALRAFARLLTRDVTRADDLVQETLVRVMGNLHKFTPQTASSNNAQNQQALLHDLQKEEARKKKASQKESSEKARPKGNKSKLQPMPDPWFGLKAWLLTIERNVFYSSLRQKRREEKGLLGFQEDYSRHNENQTGATEAVNEIDELEEKLAQLSPPLKEALVLVGAQQFSYEEAAKICGVGIGTFKARVSRARKQLSQAYHSSMENREKQV